MLLHSMEPNTVISVIVLKYNIKKDCLVFVKTKKSQMCWGEILFTSKDKLELSASFTYNPLIMATSNFAV